MSCNTLICWIKKISKLATAGMACLATQTGAQTPFVTPCQALVTEVSAANTTKTRLAAFDLNLLPDAHSASMYLHGDPVINFFYATQATQLNQQHIRYVKASIEKNLWTFQYQQNKSPKNIWIQFSLNPITGALQYSQGQGDQASIHAHGLCELPLQGRDKFLETLSQTTDK